MTEPNRDKIIMTHFNKLEGMPSEDISKIAFKLGLADLSLNRAEIDECYRQLTRLRPALSLVCFLMEKDPWLPISALPRHKPENRL
jgi:hypothetical protein